MRFQTIDNVIELIASIQKSTKKYITRKYELQKRNPEYQLPKAFYQIRNMYESIRIKKLLLIREKNKHLSYMSFS